MGGLIQTKGTQRLAKLFNGCFDDSVTGITLARTLTSSTGLLTDAFAAANVNLDFISDNFIAQHASAGSWIADLNDVLYPSATLTASLATVGANVLNFTLPDDDLRRRHAGDLELKRTDRNGYISIRRLFHLKVYLFLRCRVLHCRR